MLMDWNCKNSIQTSKTRASQVLTSEVITTWWWWTSSCSSKSVKNSSVKLSDRFATLMSLDDIQNLADKFMDITNKTAREVLGIHRNRNQPWMTTQILDACDERRNMRATRHLDYDNDRNYRKANSKVKKEIRNAKENFLKIKYQEIQNRFEITNSRKVFESVK